ncbi:MAG: peptide synthetase [Acidobacteria bacterium]|nr:peptide synthetase [Acidobacteriota bacterium]
MIGHEEAALDVFVFPTSFAQQRLWFLQQVGDGSSSYNLDLALQLDGDLDDDALERALQEIVRRHEVLRTTFAEIEGEPVQVIAGELAVPLRRIDLQSLGPEEAGAEAERLATEEARKPFDLARGPLLRATLVRLAAETNVLLLALHHIVTDAWSMDVLYHELTTLYRAFAAGEASPLPPLPIQYADYALWQREWLTGDVLSRQVGYWRERLAGVSRLELPADRHRPALKSYRGASHSWELPPELGSLLQQLNQGEGVTLFMTLLAGFALLLARHSGQTDIAVGTPIANRTRAQLDGLMGFFVNTLVLRTDLAGAPSFRTLLARVRDAALGAYAHQDLPFERLVEELQPPRDLSRNPLFDVMFHVRTFDQGEAADREPLSFDGLTVRGIERANETSKFDLTLGIWAAGDSLSASFEYNTDLFDAATITRMAGHLDTLLLAAVREPDRPVTTLPLLTAAERQQILVDWNATAAPLPETRLHTLVEAQAARTPGALAIQAGDATLTYAQLNARANRLAHWLQTRGAGPGTLTGLLLERSAELVVAALAVLKAGGAYLPLDPRAPAAHTGSLVADAGVALVLTDDSMPELAGFPETDPDAGGSPDDLAYVIYTSGSTGTPKGVEITHRAVVNLVTWHVATYGITAADRASHMAGLAFDASVWELWPYLAAGASVHPVEDGIRSSPELLLQWMVSRGITIGFLATPLAEAMLAAELPAGLALRTLLTGGDVLHRAPRHPLPFVLINHYGPTENTVVSTAASVVPGPGSSRPPIGRPIANGEVYVLDPQHQPVPVGVAGELYVGGAGLARGYRGRPDLTAERFVAHPFRGEPARLYRTGDSVRYRADGQLEFLGRLDDQIKLHGFRIEPAEIEAALARHPAIAEARVLKREDTPGNPRLVAYLVGDGAAQPAADTLSHFLRERLPAAMVPAAYVWLRELPVTRNGKLDRAALPPPGVSRPVLETRYAAPGDALEQTLATVWCEVLQLDKVGREDNFFDLGGRSLLLVRVHSQLRERHGGNVSILDLFRYPTIRSLAAHLRDHAPVERDAAVLAFEEPSR